MGFFFLKKESGMRPSFVFRWPNWLGLSKWKFISWVANDEKGCVGKWRWSESMKLINDFQWIREFCNLKTLLCIEHKVDLKPSVLLWVSLGYDSTHVGLLLCPWLWSSFWKWNDWSETIGTPVGWVGLAFSFLCLTTGFHVEWERSLDYIHLSNVLNCHWVLDPMNELTR